MKKNINPKNIALFVLVVIICLIIVVSAFILNKPETEDTPSTTSSSTSSSQTEESSTSSTSTSTSSTTSTTSTTTTTTTKSTTTTTKTQKSKTEKETELTYINGILIANKSYSLPSNYNPGVNSTAQKAFNEMQAAAKADGVSLWIRSGFRSYSYQKNLYNNYVARDGKAAADTYSARPGHSEHQTGLAFDLNSLSTSFGETKEGKWLAENCHKYGFIIRFPKGKESITGYQYEPWHVRYLGVETATKVYESGQCLEEYLNISSKYSY